MIQKSKAKKDNWVVWIGNNALGNLLVNKITSVRGGNIRILLNSYVRPIINNESIVKIFDSEEEAYDFIQ